MKNFTLFLLLISIVSMPSLKAQKLRAVKSLYQVSGPWQKWGVKRGNIIMPKKGFALYELDQNHVLVLTAARNKAPQFERLLRSSPRFQRVILGADYQTWSTMKRKKKKKKPKKDPLPPFGGDKDGDGEVTWSEFICPEVPDCHGDCTLQASDEIKLCHGNCCGAGIDGDDDDKELRKVMGSGYCQDYY